MRPFIILALPRSGTKMVCSALYNHPGIPDAPTITVTIRGRKVRHKIPQIRHEFRGTQAQFWQHPYVLSNFLKPWMTWPLWKRVLRYPFQPSRWRRIRLIHLERIDKVDGARSVLMMGYHFPDHVQDIPLDRVEKIAKARRAMDEEFFKVSDWVVSYESLTDDGSEQTELPAWFVDRFSELVGVETCRLEIPIRKTHRIILRNEGELKCLVA